MKSESKQPIFSNESIRVVSYCPVCNTPYNPLSAKILDEKEDAHLLHIQCKKCGSSIVALVLASGLGISSIGLLTDLTDDDAIRFKKGFRISANDILDIYESLHNTQNLLKYIRSTI